MVSSHSSTSFTRTFLSSLMATSMFARFLLQNPTANLWINGKEKKRGRGKSKIPYSSRKIRGIFEIGKYCPFQVNWTWFHFSHFMILSDRRERERKLWFWSARGSKILIKRLHRTKMKFRKISRLSENDSTYPISKRIFSIWFLNVVLCRFSLLFLVSLLCWFHQKMKRKTTSKYLQKK